jgi:hypothetical protein
MKTMYYPGGSVVTDDASADVILDYSVALAERRRVDIVTCTDHTSSGVPSQVRLTVGFGVPLSIHSPQAGAPLDTCADIRDRLDTLVSPIEPSEADPRNGYDVDYDFLYTDPDKPL